MTCRDVDHDVLELARGGRDSEAAARARAHLAVCESCRDRFDAQQALTAGLRAVAAVTRCEEPSADLDARVMARFESHARMPVPEPREPGASSPRWALPVFWRIAAGLVAVTAGAAWWASRGPDHTPVPSSLPARPLAAVTRQGVTIPAVARGQALATAMPTVVPRELPHLLSPEGFVSLPAAASLPDFERGEIVRFEIALAALPIYGVQIPPDAVDRPVQVDVLVGQDGHPRAIRLVNIRARMLSNTPIGATDGVK